jgi:hypothetical protein
MTNNLVKFHGNPIVGFKARTRLPDGRKDGRTVHLYMLRFGAEQVTS